MPQVMNKAQLPILTSIMMISQAVLSTPCGLRAKRSLKARNGMLLAGFGAMIAADLTFAKLSSPQGEATGLHLPMPDGLSSSGALCTGMLLAGFRATIAADS